MTNNASGGSTILVCCGTGCRANGAEKVVAALKKEVAALSLEGAKITVKPVLKETGCNGFCENGPIVRIVGGDVLSKSVGEVNDISYYHVKEKDAHDIVMGVASVQPVERLLYTGNDKKKVLRQMDNPFYAKQMKLILRNIGLIEPGNIDEYITRGGFKALKKALAMTSEAIIDEVLKAGLRGRGGAGFPAAQKWKLAAAAPSSGKAEDGLKLETNFIHPGEKYMCCNGDEGDPGAFMDRSIMEGDPHSVIEGMIIAAHAIGATRGFMYIRDEYGLALTNMQKALDSTRERGYLGKNIMATGWDFDISIVRGGGAFVCGEETALMRSIEGKRGEPITRPPYPAYHGLWNQPTVLNNVETLANVPWIINNGWEAFKKIGDEGGAGTKVFALVGKVKRTGLVEVPMGTTLRDVVFNVGGGILDDRPFKAVQTGGPSGGCIPASLLDVPMDFDNLKKYGSMMGSGGIIVMDDRTCMVEVARYYTKFLSEESCGKCTPCREGLRRCLEILTDICEGRGREGDIERLEDMAVTMANASLCALGKTAANPVLTTLKYFRDEYEEHIKNKRCPAGICPKLTAFKIDSAKCKSCGMCAKGCPVEAIEGERGVPYVIDAKKCIGCGQCRTACHFDAVSAVKREAAA